ncbi:MAG: hypothetical protein CL428_00110 [Acidimicrobiaceae bacterium]|nr:hypothetical protein [Acidimicrobiaceae bacterium]|tara:strand:- start:562 stop:783 length:222 start_codon:yes stop_codon:yes gene_type:complete
MKRILIILFTFFFFSCNHNFDNYNKLVDQIIESQNYNGEIIDLIGYALLLICVFFVMGYVGNNGNKKNLDKNN